MRTPAESPAYSVPSSCSIETWWLAWPGAGEALEPEDVVADDGDVVLRDGDELAPEAVEAVAVEPAGARLEPRGVDEVRCADLRDVHLQRRVLAHERAGGAGVVEVDVREEQMADVAELEAALREPGLQRRDARRRPAVVEREAVVGLDDVAADVAGEALVEQVDRLERGRRHPGNVPDRSFDRGILSPLPLRGDTAGASSGAYEAGNVSAAASRAGLAGREGG